MLENIFEEINQDMIWRLNELREYENILNNLNVYDEDTTLYDKQIKIILKSMLPMVYAHWEGFVKSSTEILFRYLNSLQLSSTKFNQVYLATAYEQDLIKTPDIINFEKRVEHLNCLYDKFEQFVNFGLKIDTESNLNSKVLKKICKRLKLDEMWIDTYNSELNRLLEYRNKIVHGENSLPFNSFNEIIPYIELLENLMLDFQSQLQDLLKQEKYKKGN